MAEKILTTRIKLKYDLEENWLASNLILMKGETAYVVDSLESPTVLKAKVGDGVNAFDKLPYLDSLSDEERKTITKEIIDEYNTENNFLLICGGASDDFTIPPFLTDEAVEDAVNDSLDEMLTRKF